MIMRIVYTKTDYMKFLGHLELMRFFERAFRRLQVPLKFTEGFNPHPRMTFGGPLSVGVASLYEVMEVELDSPMDYQGFIDRFNTTSPQGMRIVAYYLVSKTQSLMSALALSTYEIELSLSEGQEAYNLDLAFNEAEVINIRKKNKKNRWGDKDLKPFVKSLTVLSKTPELERYRMEVFNRPEGSAKPAQIIEVLLKERPEFDVDAVDLVRTGLFFDDEGTYKPLAQLF